jgi:hypothetical protein
MSQPNGEMKPTEVAEAFFNAVSEQMALAGNKPELRHVVYGLQKTAQGLQSMAVGLRATYLLLQEVKEMLRRHNAHPATRSGR